MDAREVDWDKVFELRCRSKRGESLSEEQRALVERAWRTDPKRYNAMEEDVFVATAPFGSITVEERTK